MEKQWAAVEHREYCSWEDMKVGQGFLGFFFFGAGI
jgi:hypothetical protein